MGKQNPVDLPQKISPLPITKTASTVQTALQGTALEGAGNAVGLLAEPERRLRKSTGLSEFGKWGDYYVDRALANMAADGTISPDQAKIAMIERQGQIYDEAYRRVQYEQMLNVPGAAALNQAAGGSVIGTLEALPQALFGGTLFPTGELKLRGLSDDFKRAYQAKGAGNPDDLNNFFAEHPEYEARLALNTDPADRLRQFLVSELWDKYGQLEKPNRSAAANQLGDQFKDAFLNKETRSYDSIPIDTLARWNQMLGGAIPQTPETAPAIESPAAPVGLYAPELTGKIEAYQAERNNKFPNYYTLQQLYYSVPETDKKGRKAILNRFPQLAQYWMWNKQYKAQHPDMQEYWSGTPGGSDSAKAASLTDKELRAVDQVLLRQVIAWTVGGQPLSSGAQAELRRLANSRQLDCKDYARLIFQGFLLT